MQSDEGKWISSNMKVEIQSKKWIKPSTPTPPHLHKLNLSSFDQLLPGPYFVPLILHFDIGNKTELLQTTPERLIARLEESLSKILTLYYPFAGRYHENEPTISCQDQGMEFVVATVDLKLNELANGEYDKEALVSGLERILWAWNVALTPVLSVQVNVFTCGGLAIGLSFLHTVSDMFTFSTFMDAWATVCRLRTLDQVVRPNFSLSSLLPPTDHFRKPPPLKTNMHPPPNFVSKRYIFTKEAILKLKSTIGGFVKTGYELNTTNYTRVELVMALITKSLINIECSKGTKLIRPLVISQPMNLRTRIALPIEQNSCGNLCIKVVAALDVENEPWELRDLARLIQNSLRNVVSEMGIVRDWNELRQKVEKAYKEYEEETRKGEKVNLVKFSSWCWFGLNEVDFGWGRPSLVIPVLSPFVITHLMNHNGDDGGIEAWVCLKEEDMARFQHELDIYAYES